MITQNEAIRLAAEHIGWLKTEANGHPDAKLVTKDLFHSDRGMALKNRRPELWETMVRSHRNYWSVVFPMKVPDGFHPDFSMVHVDAETGEVRIIPTL